MAETLLGWAGLSVLLIATTEVSYRLSSRLLEAGGPQEADEGTAYVLTAALGLLGLLIAFVFGMAADRYETRRKLVIEEANAISTAFLSQQLLPEPHRAALTLVMADYVSARLAFFDAGDEREAIRAAEARTDALQARVWDITAASIKTPEGASLLVPLLGATNGMFDAAASRHAELDARLPGRVLRALVAYALGAAALMAYGLAETRRRHLISSSGLFVLVALALSLIRDLDSPRGGGVREPQGAMEHVAHQVIAAADALSRQ